MPTFMTVLIIEDEIKVAHFIKRSLEQENYLTDVAYDGEDGLNKGEINDYDVIILDIKLPKLDGLAVCRRLREQNIHTPIIMLTACEKIEERIKGLDAGADDYLVKPFSFSELLARIRALLRREKTIRPAKLQVADLVLDPAKHEVHRDGREIHLTKKEYRILHYMMGRPGHVCTRTMLGEHIWGYSYSHESNVIDVSISALRKKVDAGFGKKLIHTIRDVGYKIQDKN
jgi:DNA-binding response OmpR family regulator